MHAQPGVYALLVGSGTSTGVGMPTGWGVIKDLVSKAAAAEGSALREAPTDEEVETWWDQYGDGQELGYSNLLENLGPTPAGRSALLNRYFEPTEDERAEGVKVPGRAHQAIAALVRRGFIRVIVTTNFDGLIEQALEAASVPHQVIAGDNEVEARMPLAHAGCTVVKIHGDYRSLVQKNTVEELSDYTPAMQELLQEVFENYGLVINGWSADWDHALVRAIKGRRSRRYPMHWSTLHPLGAAAGNLAEQQGAGIVSGVIADQFFPDLLHRLEALDSLSAPPLTEEMAISRLKKLLPYRESYIEIRDLLEDEIDKITEEVRLRGQVFPDGVATNAEFAAALEDSCLQLCRVSRILVRLVATGVMLDRDRVHTELWVWALQRLLKARAEVSGVHQEAWIRLAHYPALLVLRATALIAVTHGREDVFIRAASEPKWRGQFTNSEDPAFLALQDHAVVDHELAKAMPRWNGTSWMYPISELIATDTASLVADLIGDPAEFKAASARAEYRMALAHQFLYEATSRPSPGRYIGEWNWPQGKLIWETDFRNFGDLQAWGWEPVKEGEPDPFEEKLRMLSEALAKYDRWG